MKKSDLSTGMRVTTRGQGKYMVLLGVNTEQGTADILVDDSGFLHLYEYDEDLKDREGYSQYDIIKIERPMDFGSILMNNGRFKTIWERREPKEMTLAQIEEALGYPVKIIEEDKP